MQSSNATNTKPPPDQVYYTLGRGPLLPEGNFSVPSITATQLAPAPPLVLADAVGPRHMWSETHSEVLTEA